MKRRHFLAGVALSALGSFAPAQASRAKTVAMLWRTAEGPNPPSDPATAWRLLGEPRGTRDEEARKFAAPLEAFGLRLHRDLEIRWFDFPVFTQWDEALPPVVSRMVATKPDCIVVDGTIATRHVARATRTIPVVTGVRDPVAAGFARTLARPGGNITGIHSAAGAVDLKTQEFLRRAMPGMTCVGWIGFPQQLGAFATFEATARDAGLDARKIVLDTLQERWEARLAAQFGPLRAAGCTGALLAALFPNVVDEVVKLALRHGIAIATHSDEEADLNRDGILLQYASADDEAMNLQRMAAIVAKVLKGERPADIPFEGPSRFRLALNLRTARKIGATIPPDMRVLAERVFE